MAARRNSRVWSSATRCSRASSSRSSAGSSTVYGKTQRTTRFLAHNEGDAAKMGDRVAIAETRPMSARKRWAVTRVIERAATV